MLGHFADGFEGCAIGFEKLVAGVGVRVEACYACWPSGGAEDSCPTHGLTLLMDLGGLIADVWATISTIIIVVTATIQEPYFICLHSIYCTI